MKTSKENLKTIFFNVEKVASQSVMKNPNMEFNSDNAYAIVGKWPVPAKVENTPADIREKTLNFCSEVYQLIRNQDVIEPLIPVLEAKFKNIDVWVSNDKDAQFTVRVAPAPDLGQTMVEIILPLVTFTNSYDGKVQAQATGGMVRYLVDGKGHVFHTYSTYMKGLSFVYKFKHNNEGIYDMLNLSNRIDEYVKEFSKVTDLIERMKKVTLSSDSTKLEEFLRKMSKGTIFPLKELEDSIDRIQYESAVMDCDVNLWLVYNAMNYITENTENSLTQSMRMNVNAQIFVAMVEYMDTIDKKKQARIETVIAEASTI
jgi:hypothetical protein